jgi:hypothetical protein
LGYLACSDKVKMVSLVCILFFGVTQLFGGNLGSGKHCIRRMFVDQSLSCTTVI